jgi:hypothetical protein
VQDRGHVVDDDGKRIAWQEVDDVAARTKSEATFPAQGAARAYNENRKLLGLFVVSC